MTGGGRGSGVSQSSVVGEANSRWQDGEVARLLAREGCGGQDARQTAGGTPALQLIIRGVIRRVNGWTGEDARRSIA